MQGLFADPKTDVIFKKIFGQKERQHLLLHLLHALLELDEAHQIVELEYLSPEQLPSRTTGKLSILDVKCTDIRGVRYVIEMQVIEVDSFQKRVVYNACKAFTSQLEAGRGYPELNDVIAVTICDFTLWPQSERRDVPMLSRWHMQEQHCGATGLPEVQYVFLELPKYAGDDHPQTAAECWAYFFRETRALERVPEVLSAAPYAEALQIARLANLSLAEETEYERELMAAQDIRGGITLAARRGKEEGHAEGLMEGRQEGLVEGRQEGLIEGRREGELEGKAQALRLAIHKTCKLLRLPISADRQALIDRADAASLEALYNTICDEGCWPDEPPDPAGP